jgi:uncharacterized repeat protein (TIGR01451 family)
MGPFKDERRQVIMVPDDGLGDPPPPVPSSAPNQDALPVPKQDIAPPPVAEPLRPQPAQAPEVSAPLPTIPGPPPDRNPVAPMPPGRPETPAPRPPNQVSRPYPAFEPDEMGRRPIADSSHPISRNLDGTAIAPPDMIPRAQEAPQPVPRFEPQPVSRPIERPAPVEPPAQRPMTPPPMETSVQRPMSPPPPSGPQVGPTLTPTPAPAPAGTPIAESRNAASAQLMLEKIGPSNVNRGTALIYELVVRNVSSGQLTNVKVEDELPVGVQLVNADPRPTVLGSHMTWNIGNLDPNVERRFRVETMPTGVGEVQSCATATFTANSCLRTVITQPHLTLKKRGPETAMVGDTVTFEIELTNDGNGPATGVMLYDQLPPGLEHPQGANIEAEVGTLAPGETKRITLDCKATQPGRVVNCARATGNNGLNVTAEAVVMIIAPSLHLRKNGPKMRYIGREAEFDLEVFNPGNAPATNVQVLDRLPPELDFVSCSDNGTYDPATRSITWNLGTLKPQERNGIQLKLVGKSEGNFVNQAFARADRNLEARAEAPIQILGVGALLLEVVDLDDPIEEGNETVYEIHVINQGTGPVTNLRLVATTPAGMIPREGKGPTNARIQGQQVVFEPLDKLASHADATYRVRVLCKTEGDWRFRVQMMSDQLTAPVLEEESTHIYKDQ